MSSNHTLSSELFARLDDPAFAGLKGILNPENEWERPEEEAVADDVAGEQETVPDLVPQDFEDDDEDEDANLDQPVGLSSQWKEAITGAAKGITEKTEGEYERYVKRGVGFMISKKMITKSEDFLCATPPDDAPFFIIAWIMQECDSINADGSEKPAEQLRDSYAHAQKMRASMTHIFARKYGLGSRPWQKNDFTGKMVGNPSVSEVVGSYMVALQNRKAHAGEVANSARAITSDDLRKLYHFNHLAENWDLTDYSPGTRGMENLHSWGGPRTRRMVQAIYTIAFLCLLRADEVLKIKREHIELLQNPPRIKVTLPFRKTHQGGGIKPFFLHLMPEHEAHLCPVRALAEWIHASKITRGFMFRRMASGDRPRENDVALTSEQFLEMFRNNLLDVKIDTTPYGTHSFRRGGCQYLSSQRRWPLRRICEWGGWSTEFSNLTIVRYLISWNDNPTELREDYFNPDRAPAIKCPMCGRSCHCG